MSTGPDDDTGVFATRTPGDVWWADIRTLTVLDRQIGHATDAPSRDGGYGDVGYRPRPPEDPRWLKILMWAALLLAFLSIPVIIYWN